MKTLSLSFLLLFYMFSQAAETVIQGSIEGFENRSINVLTIEDYITSTKKELAENKIEGSKFRLTFDLENTQQLFLKIEDKQTSLFVEAGKVYNLSLSYNEEKNRGQAYNKVLDLEMSFPQPQELNQLIKKFNQDYQNFFADNYQKFIAKNAQKEIEAFIKTQKSKEVYKSNPYAEQYVRYALANLEDINRAPEDKLFNQYLKNQPILYEQKEYMNFFLQFYKEDFGQFCITKEGAELLRAIMFKKDLAQTVSLIQKFKQIENKSLAELYLINGLYEVYHDKTVEQESNLAMLEQLSEKASNKENQVIAKNVIKKLRLFGKDEMAPEFSLINHQGDTVSLVDFRGKPVYLNFWANWSIPSLRQLSVMKKLQENYGEKIHFVSVNVDEESEVMKSIKEEKNYNWTFLHYGNDFEIREKYEVKAVPSYYLIDSKGKMMQTFAPGPTEIEKKLYNL
jgi:thiol-disulfide isomerase/thioredoxin